MQQGRQPGEAWGEGPGGGSSSAFFLESPTQNLGQAGNMLWPSRQFSALQCNGPNIRSCYTSQQGFKKLGLKGRHHK